MQGIEPWSKHGINLLSTCLASLTIFETGLRLKLPVDYPYPSKI